MANLETKFYVTRGYFVKKSNMLGDGVIHGSFCDDTKAGKAKADTICEELQGQNNEERASLKPKPKRKNQS